MGTVTAVSRLDGTLAPGCAHSPEGDREQADVAKVISHCDESHGGDEQDRGGAGRRGAGQAHQMSPRRLRKRGTSLDPKVGMRGCQEESQRPATPHRRRGQSTECYPGTAPSQQQDGVGGGLGWGLGWGLLCPQTHSRSLKDQRASARCDFNQLQ